MDGYSRNSFGVINSWGRAAIPRFEWDLSRRKRVRTERSADTIHDRCAGVFRACTHPRAAQSRGLVALVLRAWGRSGSHHSSTAAPGDLAPERVFQAPTFRRPASPSPSLAESRPNPERPFRAVPLEGLDGVTRSPASVLDDIRRPRQSPESFGLELEVFRNSSCCGSTLGFGWPRTGGSGADLPMLGIED